ncbi:MAG: hypothetical protein MI724_00720 [Spirochaetales bacterium]|nr:hypothetical protein [Spirochaetales bacterium]
MIPTVDCQNRLMRVADKDLSLSLLYMSDEQRNRILALVGAAKAQRVVAELERHRHTRILYAHYETAAGVVAKVLQGGSARSPHSYYRPTGRT